MLKIPLTSAMLILALTSCGRGDADANGSTGQSGGGVVVQTDTLTGLYESGDGPRRNQLCLIDREGQDSSFGFVTWSRTDKNCSANGTASREGDRLRLRLDGTEDCTLDARVEGRRVTFPVSVPAACTRYYCGDGAQLAGVGFDKVGGTQADAARAVDLAGESLCGG